MGELDPFGQLITELCDGKRWALLRAEGWDDFVERLSDVVVRLPPRRRQALMMLLFALLYNQLTPDVAREWLAGNDADSEDGLEAMISWLRRFRPPST